MRKLLPSFVLALWASLAWAAPTRPAPAAPAPPAAPPTEVAAVDPKAAAKPPAPRAKATKVRTVEGITEYRLDNGLTVLLFPDPTQSTFTVNVTYLVGSRVEGYGETGMAHLLEHMLFKGTAKYRNVLKLLNERGAHLNGSTWTDRTNYYETLTATPDNLEFALDLEADRMVNALISPEDLKTEFSVVRNEFEAGENNPIGVLGERIVSSAYLWHNYGKDTIGSRADIERVPVPALRAFYQKYYQPDNALLVVSGKFDEKAALATIERTFGAIPKPARVLQQSYTVEPVQDGERSVTLRRNGDIHAFGVAYHTVGGASPDFPAVQAAIDVLTRQPSGRLYKKLVETKLAAGVTGYQLMFRDPYLAYFTARVRDGKNLDQVEQFMLAEIEKLGTGKIDEREVERWRTATLKELELTMANSEEISVELSEFAALGDWRTLFAYRDRVGKVTVADVQRVAAAYFKQSNRTTGRFIPTKAVDRAPHTETPDVAAAVKGIESGTVKDQGEVFAATFENIEARTTRKELKGGIKAAFLPKKTRGGKVELQLALHFGDEKSLRGKATIAQLAGAALTRGTAKRSYQDIQDLEDKLKSRIDINGSPGTFTLTLETFRDQLPAALDLAAEVLMTPTFPEKELELVKQDRLARLEQQLTDPSTLAWTTLAQITSPWPKDDPRYVWMPAERIAAIKAVRAADLRQFHRDFLGVAKAELVVVGDFDAAALAAQVEKVLGGWKSKQPYARLTQKPFNVPATTKSIEVKDKEMTQIAVAHDLAMRDTDPDYPAWLLVGHLLGGDASSRLWMRLREKEGLSYGTGAYAYADPEDASGGFGAYAIVAPQNLAKAKASILEEINKIATGKVATDELARAKESWIKDQDTNLSNDSYVAYLLRQETYLGRTTAEEKALRAKLQAVTPADLERVAKKHLQPSRLVLVDAGDPTKASAPPPTTPKP
ncbi:MAG TPA: pitrilysin family protein [Kofleriaceae bacterium]|nr:pitrilysin family protein [Kofleriaceae bacterium]